MWRKRGGSSAACRGDRGMSDEGRSDRNRTTTRGTAATPCDGHGAPVRASSVDCVEAVHELYHYLDGELTEVRREEIRVHLDWCGPCGGAADFEAELRRVIANRCQDRVPQSLMDRIAAAIEEEGSQPSAPTAEH